MGSSGANYFGEIDKIRQSGASEASLFSPGDGNGTGPGAGGKVERDRVIRLEDVATSEYYKHRNTVPFAGTPVYIGTELFNKRMVVRETDSNSVLGNLPVKHQISFIRALDGVIFRGEVASSSTQPIPSISVKINE